LIKKRRYKRANIKKWIKKRNGRNSNRPLLNKNSMEVIEKEYLKINLPLVPEFKKKYKLPKKKTFEIKIGQD